MPDDKLMFEHILDQLKIIHKKLDDHDRFLNKVLGGTAVISALTSWIVHAVLTLK